MTDPTPTAYSLIVDYSKSIVNFIKLVEAEAEARGMEAERMRIEKGIPEKIERFDKGGPSLWGEAYTKIDNAKTAGWDAALKAVRKVISQ